MIRTRLSKTIEQDLADDPYAQKVFGDLLRKAIAEAEAMFDHPLKQYALFKEFEQQVSERKVPGLPADLGDDPHARAYFGVLKLVANEAAGSDVEAALVAESRAIDASVKTAVAEHSLNPQNIEAAIRKALLPRLFALLGLEKAKAAIDHVVHITRVGLSRDQ